LLGKPSLFILLGIFFTMWVFFAINPDHDYSYVFSFYWVGCLIIGPIDVIFAYFYSILLEYPDTNMTQLWIGVAISFLIPGSHLNIGIYFGSLVHGLRGTILAAIFLYIPCFLFLLGVLPQWRHYREKGGIKRIYDGIVCATTGLTLAVVSLSAFRL
jgi:chromate transporter